MNSNNSVIILAAGNGVRLKSALPKVFHKIGGLCLVDHVIKSALGINPLEVIAVLKPEFLDCSLTFETKRVIQENPAGSADAVKCAMTKMDDNNDGYTYILYADIPLISSDTLLRLEEVAESKKADIVVLAMGVGDSHGLGKLQLADDGCVDHIKAIIEAKDLNSTDKTIPLCNTGLLIKKSVLRELIGKITSSKVTNEFYITQIVELAYDSGYTCTYWEGNKEELSGVNTRSELAQLENLFQKRERNKHMNNGVTLVAPETVFFSYDTELEQDVVVQPYVVFLPGVSVKSGAQVGPFCVCEGAEVNNAQVGPFSRLRTGSIIHDNAKVGNFVEIKNSVVGRGAKINHLTYIGDSEVGQGTNVGAGTITCNYDGFKKYKTKIGQNVFIGSNTALVAPVEIGDNAMIGAGSVITKNVADGDLALTRSAQKAFTNGSVLFRNNRGDK